MDQWAILQGDYAKGIITGSACTLIAILLVTVVIPLIKNRDVYDLAHWKLHARTPMQPLWMNIGFWRGPKGESIQRMDQACATLLRQVLATAGLFGRDAGSERESRQKRSLAIFDVGFGCGDQTWELSRALAVPTWREFRYVGMTYNPKQMDMAYQRLDREIEAASKHGVKLWPESYRLFNADAAQPESWERPTRTIVDGIGDAVFSDRWLLALDCLYHFSPSREPLLRYAAERLRANFMAFDLVLNDKATWAAILCARMICLVIGCPVFTFLTEKQYIEQLIASGYSRESIVMRDISYDVFPGFVAFMDRQERALKPYGISMGGLKIAKHIFGWFGNSGAVRAVIVVARVDKDKKQE